MTDETLFAQAAAIADPQARAAFLERACGGDSALRAEIAQLLSAHFAPGNFLNKPAPELTAAHRPEASPTDAADAPKQVGPYKLLQKIGEGGMGAVYMAEQQVPVRRMVAVKIIRAGMDSKTVLARFEAERQALALMEHANIARVLDADTTDTGTPFFVMELVKGVPVTKFCDDNKLTPRERLELFIPVCRAIQHAHQKGVIHRDIKPSNVLVALYDGKPVPKVIDFGVAKATAQKLTERTLFTEFGALVGTPEYMSPEQAEFNALDIDTRSDVYALGVLLYELLTGSTPIDRTAMRNAGYSEMLRLIREVEPAKPSARISGSREAMGTISDQRKTDPAKLSKLMRGELDWIVMKALDKDRNRRYDTANGFARDVERYLSGDSVEACPPTLGYRLRKAYRKNRAAVFTTGAIASALFLGLALAANSSVDARRAEAEAIKARIAETDQREETARQRDAAIAAGLETAKQRDERDAAFKRLQLLQDQQAADQYVWDMQTVPLAFEAGNIAEVNRLLDRHVPAVDQKDRRGFEWHYWKRQANPELVTIPLPGVVPCTFSEIWESSPDGSRLARLASVGGDGGASRILLTVWDVANGTLLFQYAMPLSVSQFFFNSIFSPSLVMFSPDGRRIAAKWTHYGGESGLLSESLLQVIDLSSAKVCAEQRERLPESRGFIPMRCAPVAFSADGRRCAVIRPIAREPLPVISKEAQVHVWDLQTGRETCDPIIASGLADSALSPDGTRLVIARSEQLGDRVSVCDTTTGKEIVGWVVPDLAAFCVSPDGSRVATVTKGTAGFKMVNPEEQKLQLLQVWDAGTGMELHAAALPTFRGLPVDRNLQVGIVFSPDGTRGVVWRNNFKSRQTRATSECLLWEVAKDSPVRSLQDSAEGSSAPIGPSREDPVDLPWIRFTPDGNHLAWAESHVMRVCDWARSQPVLTLRGPSNPIAACGFGANGARLWAVDSNGLLKEWHARPPRPVAIPFDNVYSNGPWPLFAASDDGSRVAAVVNDRSRAKEHSTEVHVWDTTGQMLHRLVAPARDLPPQRGKLVPNHRLSLSRDGRWAILTRREAKALATPQAFLLLEDAVALPSDLTAWDVASGRQLLHLQFGTGDDLGAAISPDGKVMAVAVTPVPADEATHTPTFRLFDLPAGTERPPLVGPEYTSIYALTFSPDGHRLLGYGLNLRSKDESSNLTVDGWDLATGSRQFTLSCSGGASLVVTRLAWTPDGAQFAFSHHRGDAAFIAIHDAATGTTLRSLELPDTGGSGYRSPPSLAFSPDGRRIAACFVDGKNPSIAVLKLFDAVSGKEVLSIRTQTAGFPTRARLLRFSSDGQRLLLAENQDEDDRISFGDPEPALRLTTWDGTPLPESKK